MSTIQQRNGGLGAPAPSSNDVNAVHTGNSCCGPATSGGGLGRFIPSWLGGTRGIVLVAVVAIGGGLAFGWPALVAFGVAPILLSVLPCLVMCGLGLCMMGKGGQSSATQTSTAQAPTVDQPRPLVSPEVETSPSRPQVREFESQS